MKASPRPVEYEINDLAVRLVDSGMSERSARIEAERIAASIGSHYYADGVQAGVGSAIPAPPTDVPRETSTVPRLISDAALRAIRAIHALKSSPSAGSQHYRSGFDDGLEAAIGAVKEALPPDDVPRET